MLTNEIISHEVFLKSFRKSHFPHKSVNLFFILVMVKDKLTDLWGSRLLQNDFKHTLCKIREKLAVPSPHYK